MRTTKVIKVPTIVTQYFQAPQLLAGGVQQPRPRHLHADPPAAELPRPPRVPAQPAHLPPRGRHPQARTVLGVRQDGRQQDHVTRVDRGHSKLIFVCNKSDSSKLSVQCLCDITYTVQLASCISTYLLQYSTYILYLSKICKMVKTCIYSKLLIGSHC